jgi:hypothetical protein
MRLGLCIDRYLDSDAGSAQKRERCLHFVPRVHISGLLCDDDTVGQQFPRLIELPEARKELAELEISRGITGIGYKELAEVAGCGRIIPQLHALKRQSVSRKGVGRFLGNELFKQLSAGLL